MEPEYDIFETVGGNPLWVCSIVGHQAAIARLKELAATSSNEFTVMHLRTNALIASSNTKNSGRKRSHCLERNDSSSRR